MPERGRVRLIERMLPDVPAAATRRERRLALEAQILALLTRHIDGYDVIETPEGTTLIGPVNEADPPDQRDIFVVHVHPATAEVNGD